MNLKAAGIARAVRGAREGNQALLVTGLAMVALQYMRDTKPRKQLIYRKVVPVGSTIVVRHGRRGEPRLEIQKPTRGNQTR